MTGYLLYLLYTLVCASFSRCTTFKMLLSLIFALFFQYASFVGTILAALQPPFLFNEDQLDRGLTEDSLNAEMQVHIQIN